ncbi:hypothetical protein GZH53_00820 [Flavihumibacter sp. R14]|nr:hypothetical protein [Flavihumibacter soli]
MKGKFDYIFLGVLGLLLANAVIQSYLYQYLLSINNYLAVIAWVIALTLRLGTSRYRRQAIGWLLILGTLNVLSFTLGRITISIGNISDTGVEAISLNPIILAISIAYYLTNKTAVNRILTNVFQGTKDEQEKERDKQVHFYLNKFSECDSQELDTLLKNFDDYPPEAQTALKQIQTGRLYKD